MKKLVILLVVVAGVIAVGALLASKWRHPPFKVSGFIEADEIRVGSRVGGRVLKVHVQEGQRVRAGQPLIDLDPYDLKELRAQAAAKLAADKVLYEKLAAGLRPEEVAQAQARRDQLASKLEELRKGPRKQEIAAAQERLNLAKAQLTLAQANYKRVKDLIEKGGASPLEMDRVTDELKAAQSTQAVREQELSMLNEGTRPEQITQAEAQLREAEQALAMAKEGYRKQDVEAARATAQASGAAVAAIDQQIEELTIAAPVDGTVEALELQPGDLVSASAPVLSLMDTSHLWVRAYVPENRLEIKTGDKVPVTVDSFPGRRFAAHVSFVSRQAEFTPGNVQTPEERSKQVFRIKATLDEGLDVLRPGMSADVWLDNVEKGRGAATRD
jgi:multidrug resistance efflux pump